MEKEIKADQKFDKRLAKLVFSDDEEKFQMSLICINSAEKIDLARIINAFVGSTRRLLHFDTDESSDIAIHVIGNIPEALEFLKKHWIISNEIYFRIEAESELSDFLTRSGSFVIYKYDKEDLSFLESDDEEQKPTNTSSNTTPTSQGGFFGGSGRNSPADNTSATHNSTEIDSPPTPPPGKVK